MALLSGQNATKYSQYSADQFVGTGSQTVFTLSRTPPTAASLIVTIDGVKQHSSTYSVGANQITFSEAPPSGTNIECLAIGNQGISYDPTDGSVTTAKLAGAAVTSVKIADANVTTAKIADGALTVAKLDNFSATGTGGLPMPYGTTAQRPVNPPNGTARYNTDWNAVEYFYSGFWFDRDPRSGPANITGMFQTMYTGTFGAVNAGTGGGVSVNAWGERTADASWVVPAGVTRAFWKIWGAGGGGGAYGGWRQGSRGGGGGYTQAITPVVPGETVTIRVAQRGYSRWGANKAYPDGGGASTGGGDNQYTGSGGGSSSIKIPSISAEFCLFAGGGGGGGSCTGYALNSGGAGGGFAGEGGTYTPYNGAQYSGDGGTQTAGGRGGTPSNSAGGAGSFKTGGTHQNPNNYGGGGGGGWYGGGSGSYNPGSMGGGGGGSGYVHPSLNGITLGGKGYMPGNAFDPWLARFSDSTSVQYASGGEEDGIGGAGLIVWFYI